MEDGRIPKDILYGELASGRRSKGRPQLSYKDVCKRDMKALNINTNIFLGGPCSRPRDVEKHPEPTPQDRGKEAGECRSRKKGPQKGAQQLQQTRDHTQMRLLWQRLFLPHRSLQPQVTLQQSTDRTTRMYSHDQT